MIFVTGATGFLGHSLIPHLAAEGYRIRALVRAPKKHAWLKQYDVEIVHGDLSQAACLEQAITGCRHVVHAAGLFRMWGEAAAFQQVNVRGAMNVMRAAVLAGVKKYIHISTIAVVGNPTPGQIIDETHPPHPADPYQQSKLDGERAVLHFYHQHALPVVILRPGAFYGPHGRYAFNRLFFEDPLKGLLFKVDHGRHITFPVYIGDVAAAISNALKQGRLGECYNVCGDPISHNEADAIVSQEADMTHFRLNLPSQTMITLARIWTWLSRFTGVEPYYPINLRTYIFNNWVVSSQKARDELSFRPTPFREGVRRTLTWYREAGFPWAQKIKLREDSL